MSEVFAVDFVLLVLSSVCVNEVDSAQNANFQLIASVKFEKLTHLVICKFHSAVGHFNSVAFSFRSSCNVKHNLAKSRTDVKKQRVILESMLVVNLPELLDRPVSCISISQLSVGTCENWFLLMTAGCPCTFVNRLGEIRHSIVDSPTIVCPLSDEVVAGVDELGDHCFSVLRSPLSL